jgi:hypothetical protein
MSQSTNQSNSGDAERAHELVVLHARIRLAELELEQKKIDIRLRGLELQAREVRDDTAMAPIAERLTETIVESTSSEQQSSSRSCGKPPLDEVIAWIDAHRPTSAYTKYFDYYRNYYDDNEAPVSSDHFTAAMLVRGYQIHGFATVTWFSHELHERDEIERSARNGRRCEKYKQWVLGNPPMHMESVDSYRQRYQLSNPGSDRDWDIDMKVITELGYRTTYVSIERNGGLAHMSAWTK